MKRAKQRLLSLLLAAVVSGMFSVAAEAESSASATVPVTLTVSNEYRAVNVTVPAALPVYILNGTVVTADNAAITNNSQTTAVRVTSVSVTDDAYTVGSYDHFSGSRCIALKINGCPTDGAGEMKLIPDAFPDIRAGDSLPLTYYAKISGDAENEENVSAATVVFTISPVG